MRYDPTEAVTLVVPAETMEGIRRLARRLSRLGPRPVTVLDAVRISLARGLAALEAETANAIHVESVGPGIRKRIHPDRD
jgi:hypothetical protein